jgi:hypothetical protein
MSLKNKRWACQTLSHQSGNRARSGIASQLCQIRTPSMRRELGCHHRLNSQAERPRMRDPFSVSSCISVLITDPIQGQMKSVRRAYSRFLLAHKLQYNDAFGCPPSAAGSYMRCFYAGMLSSTIRWTQPGAEKKVLALNPVTYAFLCIVISSPEAISLALWKSGRHNVHFRECRTSTWNNGPRSPILGYCSGG